MADTNSCIKINFNTFKTLIFAGYLILTACGSRTSTAEITVTDVTKREKICINDGWFFYKYPSDSLADKLIYDVRPEVTDRRDDRVADSRPTEAVRAESIQDILKPWILPSGNRFIKDTARWYVRPEGDPGNDFPFVLNSFDDSSWEAIDLPHDWAIKGPFLEGPDVVVGGGMGRLPVNGVAWYRKKLDIPATDKGRSVFLEVDGAMSYAIVWLNGHLVGGWPYGYNSFRLDLTPYISPGGDNQLAIRIDNPANSARWYPGAGIYRNVWLVKTDPVHVAQWGTFITTPDVSIESATINLEITIDNDSENDAVVEVNTEVYSLGPESKRVGEPAIVFPPLYTTINARGSSTVNGSVILQNPRLWGPLPVENPELYEAVTKVVKDGETTDTYVTQFGIRSVTFDPDRGILVNGEHIPIKGVNQHHDLGALGAAFNLRAAERQLEILKEMGCNAIRTSHNPPAPELLELTDRMGFLVIDEIFDVWERRKTPLDFHLIFPDWYEQDTRSFVRRDRNHPSVILWSYGNEVGEQYTGAEGAELAKKLADIVKDEDPTRLTTASMNYARPGMEMPAVTEVISLNYQGEGIRDAEAYSHLRGIRTSPLYKSFHDSYPDKVILSSETASALSTRGTYIFPVIEGISAPAEEKTGGDQKRMYVSAYELYTSQFGASPDKVFAAQDRHPYVAGEFVWSGWDYLGEPTPYYSARSSYCGIIDLSGFKKDRFYLYQSRWKPELPFVHILPHWNWPGRVGEVTPVHVFTSGDEAELFLNGKSLGRKKKGQYEYRLRWDNVKYEPGELKVVAYKDSKKWAEEKVKTTDKPARLIAEADRSRIKADGNDLSFITIYIGDKKGNKVPDSDNLIEFSIEGPAEIVATDNGDPSDMEEFPSNKRKAFSGMALVIIRSEEKSAGLITVRAISLGLKEATIRIIAE
ncbi:MAG: Beta-galactosidase [Bacteroidetes bacterium ADurb.Bin145]|nr:MAG: Beta-galactosidase [Bacteroidetes bacterium ADurb.Bin145]